MRHQPIFIFVWGFLTQSNSHHWFYGSVIAARASVSLFPPLFSWSPWCKGTISLVQFRSPPFFYPQYLRNYILQGVCFLLVQPGWSFIHVFNPFFLVTIPLHISICQITRCFSMCNPSWTSILSCLIKYLCILPGFFFKRYGDFTKIFSYRLNYPCVHAFINTR